MLPVAALVSHLRSQEHGITKMTSLVKQQQQQQSQECLRLMKSKFNNKWHPLCYHCLRGYLFQLDSHFLFTFSLRPSLFTVFPFRTNSYFNRDWISKVCASRGRHGRRLCVIRPVIGSEEATPWLLHVFLLLSVACACHSRYPLLKQRAVNITLHTHSFHLSCFFL